MIDDIKFVDELRHLAANKAVVWILICDKIFISQEINFVEGLEMN